MNVDTSLKYEYYNQAYNIIIHTDVHIYIMFD